MGDPKVVCLQLECLREHLECLRLGILWNAPPGSHLECLREHLECLRERSGMPPDDYGMPPGTLECLQLECLREHLV